MNTQVTLTMKEQHKLKMVIDKEAGKVHAQIAAELLGISKQQFSVGTKEPCTQLYTGPLIPIDPWLDQ